MTLQLCFDKASPLLGVGTRWRLGPEHDPLINPWADVIITKVDGAGYFCISPAGAYLAKRPGEQVPERVTARLDMAGYQLVQLVAREAELARPS